MTAYEDGFFVYSPYNLDLSSLFLSQEQIERGPQNVGGRNAAAGSSDMISVRPTDTPYAEIRANIANFGTYNIEGAVSGQVAPGLDVRIAGYYHNQDQGYYKNLVNGLSEGNEIHEWYIQPQLDWKPNDKTELWVRAFAANWNNRGDAGARSGFANGSWDETNLTDANSYPGAGLFVNPNFGYAAAAGGNPAANAALVAAGAAASARTRSDLGDPGGPGHPQQPLGHQPEQLRGHPAPHQYAEQFQRLQRHLHLRHHPWYPVQIHRRLSAVFLHTELLHAGHRRDVVHPARQHRQCRAHRRRQRRGLPGCSSTGGPLPAVTKLPASALVINPTVDLNYVEDDGWWSHEISLQSTGDSPLQWTGGLYYYNQHYSNPIQDTAKQANFTNPDYAPPGAVTSAACAALSGFCGFSALPSRRRPTRTTTCSSTPTR